MVRQIRTIVSRLLNTIINIYEAKYVFFSEENDEHVIVHVFRILWPYDCRWQNFCFSCCRGHFGNNINQGKRVRGKLLFFKFAGTFYLVPKLNAFERLIQATNYNRWNLILNHDEFVVCRVDWGSWHKTKVTYIVIVPGSRGQQL